MAIKDINEGSNIPEENKNHTRTGIQKVVEPAVEAALKSIVGLDLSKPAHIRRSVRAIANIAVRMMLDAGATPTDTACQLGEALSHELEERGAAKDAEGEAQAEEAQAQGAAPIFTVVKGGGLKN